MEAGWELLSQGAEGKVWSLNVAGRPSVVKERSAKAYRHPSLDAQLTKKRVLAEARSLAKCRRAGLFIIIIHHIMLLDVVLLSINLGLDTPGLLLVDLERGRIFMERIDGETVKVHSSL